MARLIVHFARCVSLLVLTSAAGSALAEDPATTQPACTALKGENGIRVVLCTPGLTAEALSSAGREACGPLQRCNAWIWDSADNIPDYTPSKDADIRPEDAGSAVAVWANDSKQLLLIEAVPR
jgi:hypothetical protein